MLRRSHVSAQDQTPSLHPAGHRHHEVRGGGCIGGEDRGNGRVVLGLGPHDRRPEEGFAGVGNPRGPKYQIMEDHPWFLD